MQNNNNNPQRSVPPGRAAMPGMPSAAAMAAPSASAQPMKLLENMPLAMAYVPMQRFENLFETSSALSRGTIFKDLDLPFKGKAGR